MSHNVLHQTTPDVCVVQNFHDKFIFPVTNLTDLHCFFIEFRD